MHPSYAAVLRALGAAALLAFIPAQRADAIPVFANGQGISCETCHTTFPGMTRYGMMVMMSNFQILNRHLQDRALPISARLYIQSILANKDHPGSTMVSDLSLLGGGFLGRNFTWYAEQHVIDSGVIGQTEQVWISWNGLLHGTNSIQVGKFHTPFPFMPAHAWTISPYLLAAQTTGQNQFNPNDARWGAAFNGMSNEFMYNVSWLTGSGSTGDALDYNQANNPRAIDLNVSYGGMSIPWSVGLVGMRGWSPLNDPASGAFLGTQPFTREGVYFAYQTDAWHYQSMYYHGQDANPDIGAYDVPLNGFFFEAERDLGWRNHLLLRYDVASSDTLTRQVVADVAHNVLPNLALIGELATYPGQRPQIAFQMAYGGPYDYGRRFLSNLHVASAQTLAANAPPPDPSAAPVPSASPQAVTGAASADAGAKLVQANGCEGCHGAGLHGGGVAPALFGIEHKLTAEQIANAIVNPKPPMPNFGFTTDQVSSIVTYLSNLDGGSAGTKPVVTFDPAVPTDMATISIRFPGTPPKSVSVLPIMQMGASTMQTREVTLTQSASDPHLFTGRVVFSMGGPWTVRVQYDGQTMTVPLNVGQ
ncbi:MAG TPA: cytochrome c [Candidatus Baltobacteraceae bacterium]|nr:cytochrome c [Candidatus Baltobacteraceae bacterium]